jgi:hypothetical protein
VLRRALPKNPERMLPGVRNRLDKNVVRSVDRASRFGEDGS